MMVSLIIINQLNEYLLKLYKKDVLHVRLSVLGIGGAGCNAVNNMIKKRDLTGLLF